MDDLPDGVGVEVVTSELLLHPETCKWIGRCLTDECLARLNLEESAIVDNEVEGDLQGNILGGCTPGRRRNACPQMGGAFGAGWGVTAVGKEITPCQSERVKNGSRLASSVTVEENFIKFIRDGEGRVSIIMRWTTDCPASLTFPAASAALNDSLRTVTG